MTKILIVDDDPACRDATRVLLSGEGFDVETAALKAYCLERGDHAFRADQVLTWIYHRKVDSFEAMSNLPHDLRKQLARDFTFGALKLVTRQGQPQETVR